MKVSELVEKLNKFPPEAQVFSCWTDLYKPDLPLLDVHMGPPTGRGINDDRYPTAPIIAHINPESVLLITTDYSNLISDEEWKSPQGESFDEMMVRYAKRRSARPKDLAPWPSIAKQVEIYKHTYIINKEDNLNNLISRYVIKQPAKEKTFNKTLEDALDSLDSIENVKTCIQVDDLSDKFLPLLSEDLRLAIQNKVTQQISFDHICKYHAITIKKNEEEKALKKLAEDIETVNKSVKIVGNLAACSVVNLNIGSEFDALELPKVIFIFIAIKLEDSDEYDRLFQNILFSSVEEGDYGKRLE